MKKMIIALMCPLLVSMLGGCATQTGGKPGKRAILVTSFGTSYPDTRKITIEATENRFRDEFPDYDVVRAFTSQMIIDILKERDNIEVFNVKEGLEHLKKEEYSEVIVQPLHIMNGAEYDELVEQTEEYEEFFTSLKISKPLLTSVEDYTETVEALNKQIPELEENEAVVFMGHGTHHHANAAYAALEYTFHDLGHKNVFVGTVEGYPMIESVQARLEENNIEKVILMPFMIVAGDHASNDMAGDDEESWKTILKKQGYEVECYLHGLGENKAIQDIYLKHAYQTIESNGEHSEE